MAISVDWGTKVISVPKADMTLLQPSPEIRELDTDQFRLDLKALEAGSDGMTFLDTHQSNAPVTVGGVALARVIEIINGYTITFEDDQYAVNLVGSNNNFSDVANVNQVSIRASNSAGLIEVVQGSGVTEQDKLDIADRVWDEDIDSHQTTGTFGGRLRKLLTKIQLLAFK